MPTLNETIKKIKPSVVPIGFEIPSLKPGPINVNITGTGFIISKNGYICTCTHVITGKQGRLRIGVKENGKYVWAISEPVLVDNERDIAIIKLPPPPSNRTIEFIPVEIGNSDSVEEGEEIAFCGFPFGGGTGGGFTPSTTKGLISAFRPKKIGEINISHFQLDAMVMEGNSGSPAFEVNTGKVVGIVNARFDPMLAGPQIIIGGRPLSSPTNIGFAIPINLARPVIKAVLEKKPNSTS